MYHTRVHSRLRRVREGERERVVDELFGKLELIADQKALELWSDTLARVIDHPSPASSTSNYHPLPLPPSTLWENDGSTTMPWLKAVYSVELTRETHTLGFLGRGDEGEIFLIKYPK